MLRREPIRTWSTSKAVPIPRVRKYRVEPLTQDEAQAFRPWVRLRVSWIGSSAQAESSLDSAGHQCPDDRSGWRVLRQVKEARSTEDGHHLRCVAAQAVDDPIGSHNHFPKPGDIPFRHNPPGLRKQFEPLDGHEEATHDQVGVCWRVLSDVVSDRVQVAQGLRRPDDFRHTFRRVLASR